MQNIADVIPHLHDYDAYVIPQIYRYNTLEEVAITFEWDENKNKNKTNIEKHGISFPDATSLWADADALQFESTQLTDGEKRFLIIAKFNDKVWSAIFTLRNDNIRIISVRRARHNEEAIYHG